ncbi:MAG TPA: AAA family ATPase [Rhodospirillaceae bacterium]|nr:AAA family ATPase [Rhodospirillaceae bacterium]
MIHFRSLRLSGFKSFVDPTEMQIEPGMTGIVGPNGCGKSNLVEALRWVMGETSAKQMRGGEMDDVIFGGSARRPARNLAEVSIVLDNRDHQAPTQFNDADEIEVTRRLDRGQGSSFKVNGREVRARDVQILFADASSGARSTALVSQGRIGAIISAKPADRRMLLEEAAGIGGLHSRRHEAELRLKAAEANLLRVDDVLAALATQLQGLKRQARQAARYRSLSSQIRSLESRLLAALWLAAVARHEAAKAAEQAAGDQVNQATGRAAAAAAAQAEAAAGLPALRQAATEAAAHLVRVNAQRDQLEADASRLAEASREIEARLQQIAGDGERERARSLDAEQNLARLAGERGLLDAACEGEAVEQAAAEATAGQAQAAVAAGEAELNRLLEELAAADAERAAALRAHNDAENRRRRLEQRLAEVSAQHAQALAETVDQADLTSAEMDLEEAVEYLEICRGQAEDADHRRQQAGARRDAAREALQTISAARARLNAEAGALRDMLGPMAEGALRPVLDQVSAVAGYEAALGAALGEDLSAPLDGDAPITWRSLPPLPQTPPLPPGVEPLTAFVTAPPGLARRLGQIGVAADAEAGLRLAGSLAVGQRLVTVDGDLWRWDGLTARAGAPNAAAARLRQRNRLRELESSIDDAEIGLAAAEEAAQEAAAAVEQETLAERQARDTVRTAEAEAAKMRAVSATLAQRAAGAQSRLAALAGQLAAAEGDLAEARTAEAEAVQRVACFTGNDSGRDRVAGLRADLAERRTGLVEATAILERLRMAAAERRRRLEAIAAEEKSWNARAGAAGRHVDELERRRQEAEAERHRLATLPDEIEERRQRLLDDLTAADAARRAADGALADGEQGLAAADRALKEAEHSLAARREERIRLEAATEAEARAAEGVAERIAERLELTPEGLLQQTDSAGGEAIEEVSRKLDRLQAERDGMGPVNLRADTEAEEMEAQIATLNAERDDLTAAIAKLRHAIGEINREGRARLLASFEEVDQHFRDLFVRLFGGGRAHLALTESNDPLQAGLEIMASPPGKRLQVLSLLSGGEQALTALALLFAVFMTNPAPICVLDEVDAPLDDANVDRFCTLVGEIALSSRTRFLVVTHHRMTMARMDRLFGVTMAERGISTLVSVDLAKAEELREPA